MIKQTPTGSTNNVLCLHRSPDINDNNSTTFKVAKSPYQKNLVMELIVAGKGYKAHSPKESSRKLLWDVIENTKLIPKNKKGSSKISDVLFFKMGGLIEKTTPLSIFWRFQMVT